MEHNTNEKTVNIADLLIVLKKCWILMLIVGVVACCCTVTYAFLTMEPSLPIHSQCANAVRHFFLSDLVLGSFIPTKGTVDNRNQQIAVILYFPAAGIQGLTLSHFRSSQGHLEADKMCILPGCK